jgi:hypothetical protein
MTTFHPVYGDLMTAKEVSDVTGFTPNQLRNWRMEARAHLAPFGSIQIGRTSFYRQVVVQDWIDENGRQDGTYRMTDRDRKFPLNVAVEGDIKKRDAMSRIQAVTPENVKSWQDYLFGVDQQRTMHYSNIVKNEFLSELLGREVGLSNSVSADQRFSEPVWFEAVVPAMRLQLNEMYGLGLSRDEVLSVPIGQVPPIKEVKK